jgi:hypothetical protein
MWILKRQNDLQFWTEEVPPSPLHGLRHTELLHGRDACNHNSTSESSWGQEKAQKATAYAMRKPDARRKARTLQHKQAKTKIKPLANRGCHRRCRAACTKEIPAPPVWWLNPARLCFNLSLPRLIGEGTRVPLRLERKVIRRRDFFTRFPRKSDEGWSICLRSSGIPSDPI